MTLAVAGLLGGSAAALEPPPPRRDFPSPRPLDVSDPLPEETARDPLALPPIPAPHWSSLPATLRVFVAEIAVEGNSVLPEEVVAGAVALYVGRELDTADLEALRESLQRVYLDSGYVNTRVVLPDQDLEGGVLRLRVVEGRLSKVIVTGNHSYRDVYFVDRLRGAPDRPLDAFEIERRLRALQAEPGIEETHATLEPGDRPDEAVLRVAVVESSRLRASLDYGNMLNPAIGEQVGHIAASVRNPLGLGDVLVGGFGISEGLKDVALGYVIHAPRSDTRLQLDFRWSKVRIIEESLEALDIESRYLMAAIDLAQPLWLGENSGLVAGVRAEWRQSRSTVLGFPFAFSDAADEGRVSDSVLRFYQEWRTRTRHQAIAVRSTWSVGLDVLGATSGPTDTAEFAAWLGQLQWLYRFEDSGLELRLRGNVQLALDPLLPFERYSVGGVTSVRGYRENLLIRDNGYSMGLTAILPLRRDANGRNQLAAGPFVDFGRSWNHGRGGTPGPQNLASIGAVALWSPRSWLRFELAYGAQLRDVTAPGEQGIQDHGVAFRVFASVPAD